jgi:hypothetical protein
MLRLRSAQQRHRHVSDVLADVFDWQRTRSSEIPRNRMSKPQLPFKCSLLTALCLVSVACQHAATPAAEPPLAPQDDPEPSAPAPLPVAEPTAEAPPADLKRLAGSLHEFFLHDECTGPFAPQPDTCAHQRVHEQAFSFGGDPGSVYDVTLHVRGIFEPTTIEGGTAPDPQHPYFMVGGEVKTLDWSYWHIEVSEPQQTYYLNHYPSVEHIIYKEDFEITIPVAGGAKVVVRVIDGNDRQIDNGEVGPDDRQQIIEGVVDEPLAGQMLRLDVTDVKAR